MVIELSGVQFWSEIILVINLVPRSQSSVRECRNVRSGKVRYNAISGWLPELRMPHSNLLCDWLFPSVFGFRSVRGRNKNTEKFSLRLRCFSTYMPFVWGENSEKLFFRKTTATLAEKSLQ